jgi:PiT family inorganic phosphate transporter
MQRSGEKASMHASKKGAQVRWSVAGRMVIAWVLTLPAAGLVGALCWYVAHAIGGALGVAVVFAILVATAAGMYARSRRTAINPDNVNAEWEGGLAVREPEDSPEPVAAVSSQTERN